MSSTVPQRDRPLPPLLRSTGGGARRAAGEPDPERSTNAETLPTEQYGRHRGEGRPGLARFSGTDYAHTSRAPRGVLTDEGKADMTDDRTTVLQPTGRLNMIAAPAFKSLVEETVAGGQTRIVVDLGHVTFIDSSGLGALIAGLKATRQAGGDLRIADVPEQVLTVLRLTNLDRVLRAHPSVADASHDW